MSSALAGAARRGALWLGLVNLLSKGSQIIVTLALGTFFTEAELGTVTITIAVLNFGIVLQSAGAFDVIARTSEEPSRFAGTVASLSLMVGVAFAVLVGVLSPTIAQLAGAPGSADLLRVAVISLPFTAYTGVQMGVLHRNLEFRRRLIPEAGSALAGSAVTVTCAAAGVGEWSLVAGVLVTAVLAPVINLILGVRIRLRWSAVHARVVGRWASVTGPGAILGLVLLNVDYVVISRALGESATGIYSFAYRIAFVPYIMGAVVLGQVAFPIYTRLMATEGSAALGPAFSRFVHVVAAATGGVYLAFALLSDRIIVIAPRWAPSAPVLRVLCIYGLLLGLVLTGHEALRAAGRPGLYLRAQLCHVLLLVVAAVALVRWGIIGVAWAQVGAVGVAAVLVATMLGRLGLMSRAVGFAVLRPVLAAAVVASAYWAAERTGLLPVDDSLVGGLVLGALVLTSYAAVVLAFDRSLKRDVLMALRRR